MLSQTKALLALALCLIWHSTEAAYVKQKFFIEEAPAVRFSREQNIRPQ
jgi:hypothetical protein